MVAFSNRLSARQGPMAPCGTRRLCAPHEASVQVLYYYNDNTPGEATHSVWHTTPGDCVSFKVVPPMALLPVDGSP